MEANVASISIAGLCGVLVSTIVVILPQLNTADFIRIRVEIYKLLVNGIYVQQPLNSQNSIREYVSTHLGIDFYSHLGDVDPSRIVIAGIRLGSIADDITALFNRFVKDSAQDTDFLDKLSLVWVSVHGVSTLTQSYPRCFCFHPKQSCRKY